MKVTREYHWSMGHRLQSHEGLCRHPHGHNYRAEITVSGTVQSSGSESGMVIDFSRLDAIVKPHIEIWDHAFMVEDDDPFGRFLGMFMSEQLDGISSEDNPGQWARAHVKVAVVPWAPTAENIASELAQLVRGHHLNVHSVRVYETDKSWADWGA